MALDTALTDILEAELSKARKAAKKARKELEAAANGDAGAKPYAIALALCDIAESHERKVTALLAEAYAPR